MIKMARQKGSGGIVIGAGCVNRCSFCDFLPNYRPLGINLKKEEVRILKDLLSFRKKGYSDLDISGSDPIEYTKIVPLVRYIRKLGFVNIRLSTHGRRLADKNFAREIIKAGVNIFRIPVYGSNAKIHDSITQAEGSFDEAINGIKSIKNMKKQVGLNIITAIVNKNKEDALNILKLALKLKPDNFQFDTPYLYPSVKDMSYHVPYRDLGRYLERVMEYISENRITNVQFNDIPSCVFGFDNKLVVMPKYFAELKKWKIKPKMCEDCIVSYKCNGFYANDISKYGIGGINPITSNKPDTEKYGSIIIIPGCRNKCVFCTKKSSYSTRKIETNEKKIYKSLLYFKKIGVSRINISGNDPIEYSKITQLVGHIKKLGFEDITIATHARNLSSYNFAREIIGAGANAFTIPLYGSNEKIHESVTMSKGSFQEAVKAIRNLKSLGAKVYISSMILKQNKENLIELIEFFGKLKVDGCSITVSYMIKDDCSHIPIKDIGRYVMPLYIYSAENKIDISFIDFPYCVIGSINDNIINTIKPYNRGYCQPSKKRRAEINLPLYRVKTKIGMCELCKARDICGGFYADDIKKYGTGNLKPII